MPWYFPWSESIKKRACRYLLQHYLGDFLKEKLTLEQLTVDLYNGKGTVSDVPLDVWALNELLENVGIPLEIIDGFISSISVAVPWTSLLCESCNIDLNGLELTFAPKQKPESFHHGGSMFDSTMSWNSMNMTTSMQLAEQCLKQDPTAGEEQAESAQMFEGLEAFAQTIESVLSRIKLSFTNTIIRLENIPPDCTSGVGLELHIDRIDYMDLSHDELCHDPDSAKIVYEPVAIATKNFQILGLKLYMDEFPYEKRTRLRETEEPHHEEYNSHGKFSSQQYPSIKESETRETTSLMPQVQILGSHGKQSVRLKIKHNDTLPGPKIDLDYSLGALNIFLSPKQLHFLFDIADRISKSAATNSSAGNGQQKRNKMRPMNSDDFMRVEQVLQQQVILSSSNKKKTVKAVDSWPNKLDSINSLNSLNSTDDTEEEFYSMSDYNSLPPLAQPPKIGPGLVGESSNFSGFSPEKSLNAISLGSNNSLLSNRSSPRKGSLTEQAKNVFTASSPPLSQVSKKQHILKPPASLSNASSGLIGITTLDDTCDLTNFKIRSNNIILILLHQDLIDTGKKVGADHSLTEISDDFFEGIASFSTQNLFGESGEDARKDLAMFCSYDHIRILMSAVTTTCEVRTVSVSRSLNVDFVIGKLAVDEYLYDKTKKRSSSNSFLYSQTKLLHFPTDQTLSVYPKGFGAAPSPCVKVKVQKTERAKSSLTTVQSRAFIIPKSLVQIQVGRVEVEVDISIMDRMAAVLNPTPLYIQPSTYSRDPLYSSFFSHPLVNRQTAFNQAMEESPTHVDSKTDLVLSCPHVSILLRFPIPDLRPASHIDKLQWWQKSCRSECSIFNVHSLEFKTTISPVQTVDLYEIRFKEAEGFLRKSEKEQDLKFLHTVCSKSDEALEEMHLDWPRIVICKRPTSTRSVFEDVEKDIKTSPESQFDSLEETFPWPKSEPSPFASNPAMYEKEELVMPGSVAEMMNFQETASATSKLLLNFNFPELRLNLLDKSTFELIYNRLFNDLLMWETSAPTAVETASVAYSQLQNIHVNLSSQIGFPSNQKFFMCRSGIKDGYDSDSDRDTSLASTSADGLTVQNEMSLLNQESNVAVSIHIDHGKVAFFPPSNVPDEESATENEEQVNLGHVVIEVDDLNFFTITSYKGDVNLDYLHLFSGNATLYHTGQVDSAIDRFDMEDALTIQNMNKTIYRSEESVLSQIREAQDVGSESVSTLSVAVKTTHIPTRNTKDVLVAVGLRGSTLQHVFCNVNQNWLTQVMDFMAVEDQEVLGYAFPSVITTLYLQLWGCSIDYRPKNLCLRSILTVETFSLSSNISPGASESVLRFIIDDSALYLSDKRADSIDILKDYVCVMDLGLFELVLRLSESADKKRPKVDLSMSNNVLNIHTCSDSCAALMKLIKYIASDGDLVKESTEDANESNSHNESTENLYSRSSVDETTIDSLMADALIEHAIPPKEVEVPESKPFIDEHGFTPSELFSSSATSVSSSSTKSLQERLADAFDDSYDEDSTSDDEYCILEENDQNEDDFEPVARKLTSSNIEIKDNYFQVPRGRYDLLSAPIGYPVPVYRYTLREMSVVWQMYGGKDFQCGGYGTSPFESSSPKLNSFSPRRSPQFFARDNKRAQQFRRKYEDRGAGNDERDRRIGKMKGGIARDEKMLVELHLNKIRFQHEIYPDNVDKISRDVLLIYDVEIADLLQSSQINKLLYRFSSGSLPLKSSANMVTMKLLLTKPEDGVKNKEGSLRMSVQPIRLNIDQDTMFFIKQFFTELSDDNVEKIPNTIPNGRPVKREPLRFSSSPANDVLGEELNLQDDHFAMNVPAATQMQDNVSCQDEELVFFRSVVFSPEVPIRLDYHGKSVNMDQGTLTGLLIGLARLNCSEIKLKRLCCRSGLLGMEKILSYALNEWLMDIKTHQIPGILGGVGPTYSFVQLYQGIKDLFWLPVQQYRQDGRLVRGLQKGAHSFSTSTAMAVLEITNRLVQTVQVAAETAHDMVSPSSSVNGMAVEKQNSKAGIREQPVDFREGVTNAYNVLSEGISQTASTIVKVAVEEHERKGVTGAVGGVLRQIPPSIMQPLILATEATSSVLGGAMNQLSPDARIEATKKWKSNMSQQK